MLKVSSSHEVPHRHRHRIPTTEVCPELESAVGRKVKLYREEKELPELKANPKVILEARKYSENMATGKIPFSPDGFSSREIAINVARKLLGAHPATDAFKTWTSSDSNRANMLGDYNQSGIGVVKKNGVIYFTQIFIKV